MTNQEHFQDIKCRSEELWQTAKINPEIFGFQVQSGTKWLPGLSDAQVAEYERTLGFSFPEVLKDFLKVMNGTDTLAVNVYGETGEPYRYSPLYYSFPRDTDIVIQKLRWIYESFGVTQEIVTSTGLPQVFPVVGHRFLVLDHADGNPVLSMYEDDVIVYARSLPELIENDIFAGHRQQAEALDIRVNFWLKS